MARSSSSRRTLLPADIGHGCPLPEYINTTGASIDALELVSKNLAEGCIAVGIRRWIAGYPFNVISMDSVAGLRTALSPTAVDGCSCVRVMRIECSPNKTFALFRSSMSIVIVTHIWLSLLLWDLERPLWILTMLSWNNPSGACHHRWRIGRTPQAIVSSFDSIPERQSLMCSKSHRHPYSQHLIPRGRITVSRQPHHSGFNRPGVPAAETEDRAQQRDQREGEAKTPSAHLAKQIQADLSDLLERLNLVRRRLACSVVSRVLARN